MSTVANADSTIRVMALHALAYCERLFYLEEVEEIRVADAAVYAGRRLQYANARIRYHANNTTVRVPVDDTARADVRSAVARARELSQTVERPPVADNDRLCLCCSLAPVCCETTWTSGCVSAEEIAGRPGIGSTRC